MTWTVAAYVSYLVIAFPLTVWVAAELTRDAAVAVLGEVVDSSDVKVPKALRCELPELLWLMQMGLVLFWVHDSSPDQRRTWALIDGAVPLVDKVLRLTRLPLVRGVVDDVADLAAGIRDPGAPA